MPSHVAGLQLRRRLVAEHGAFAAVRFETLPRLAELLAAGDLARAGKSPLARPIGDYLASQVALEARDDLAAVRNLPGFGRVLRQTFRRLRRGGFLRPQDVPVPLGAGLLGEVVRLYGLYRARCSQFYDDEDLLEAAAAAVEAHRAEVAAELGEVYVVPPGARSAGSERLLTAIRRAVGRGRFHDENEYTGQDSNPQSDSQQGAPETRLVLAPDPASEVREVVRVVIDALRDGAGLHEIGVFHGADPSYRALLSQAFEAGGVPINALPGVPLSETAAGRGVLMLAGLPLQNYSRTQVIDWLSLAPLRTFLPAAGEDVMALPAPWRREAREAGITQGIGRWRSGLDARVADLEARMAEADDAYRARYEEQRRHANDLRSLIEGIVARMEPLRERRPAADFIKAFKAIVEAYMDPEAPAFGAVLGQIDQLGTIDKVGGSFSLETFAGALRANLDIAHHRESKLGDGVFVSDYRLAGGLRFEHVVLCGAYEGVFPAGAPAEPLVEDRIWQDLRAAGHSMIEDAALRLEYAQADARRAIESSAQRLTWTAPLQASGAGREHYPAQLMVAAARALDPGIDSATALRRTAARPWLSRPASPTAALLNGTPVDITEVRIRRSIQARSQGIGLPDDHAVAPALRLLASRKGDRFGPYDGNLAELAGDALIPRGSVSPTALETYAQCGMRYLLGYVLRLRPPDEPEDRETMDPAERGSLVHAVLQTFFERKLAEGRPQPGERWTDADRDELLSILIEKMQDAHDRGKTGLDVYAEHELRRIRADMVTFLEEDNKFRALTGAVPRAFEQALPPDSHAAIPMRGYVDRIDWTPDGRKAWIIDYKTGKAYEGMKDDDPMEGGTRLQLPAYMAAATGAESITPLYWFISAAGNFTQKPFAGTDDNMRRYRETIEAIVAGVRGGVFPAVAGEENTFYGGWDNCRYCDFNRLCSRRRDDELFVKLEDPSLRPWSGVAEAARRRPE